MSEAHIRELEIKISFLEKHVEGQDRAMMELSNSLAALERRVLRLADSVKAGSENGPAGTGSLPDERPPHY